MKYLLLFLLLPVFSAAQDNKGRGIFAGSFHMDLPKNNGTAFGFRLNGGATLAEDAAYLGAGVGVVKFQQIDKPYIPLFANVTFGDMSKKVFPLVVIEPGYGFYNNSVRISNTRVSETKGGFTLFAGGGLGFNGGKRARSGLMVGFSQYTFKTDEVKSSLNGLTVRATFMGL